MTTLRTSVVIPSNHQLRLDVTVPGDVPPGKADVLIVISADGQPGGWESIRHLAGALAKSRTFAGDPVAIQRELRDEW